MGQAMRGEGKGFDFFVDDAKKASLEIAAGVLARGGPKGSIQRSLLDLPSLLGNSDQNLKKAVDALTPKLIKTP